MSLEDFDREVKAVLSSSKGKLSPSLVTTITALAISNIASDAHLVSTLFRSHKKCLPSNKLSSLYLIDSIAREARSKAKKAAKAKEGDGKEGAELEGFLKKLEGVLSKLVVDCWENGEVAHREKVTKVLDIWTKVGTFSATALARIGNKLLASGTTTSTTTSAPVAPAITSPSAPSTSKLTLEVKPSPVSVDAAQPGIPASVLALMAASQAAAMGSKPAVANEAAAGGEEVKMSVAEMIAKAHARVGTQPVPSAPAPPAAPQLVLDPSQLALLQSLASTSAAIPSYTPPAPKFTPNASSSRAAQESYPSSYNSPPSTWGAPPSNNASRGNRGEENRGGRQRSWSPPIEEEQRGKRVYRGPRSPTPPPRASLPPAPTPAPSYTPAVRPGGVMGPGLDEFGRVIREEVPAMSSNPPPPPSFVPPPFQPPPNFQPAPAWKPPVSNNNNNNNNNGSNNFLPPTPPQFNSNPNTSYTSNPSPQKPPIPTYNSNFNSNYVPPQFNPSSTPTPVQPDEPFDLANWNSLDASCWAAFGRNWEKNYGYLPSNQVFMGMIFASMQGGAMGGGAMGGAGMGGEMGGAGEGEQGWQE